MTQSVTKKPIYLLSLRLGRMSFSLSENALCSASGASVHLRPQSLKILQILAQKNGKIVSKDALIEAVWPNLTVSDDSLTQCVADIRKALGDRERTILRTVPKYGYVLHATPAEKAPDILSATADAVEMVDNIPQAMLLIAPVTETLAFGEKQSVLDQLNRTVCQSGAKTIRTADNVHLSCTNVEEAVAIAFRTLETIKDQYASRVCVKIGICLAYETNGSLEDKLKDIAFFPIGRTASSIVLSCPAREQLKPNVYYDVEDLGSAKGSIFSRCFSAFKITDRHDLAPSLIGLSDDILATIAVLPLRSRTPGNDPGTIGELIADDIVSELSPSPELRVIARLSTTNLRVREADLASIASYLNANFVVSGSYAVNGSKLRMRLELSDVITQTILWSERSEVEIAEVVQGVVAIEEIGVRIRQAISVYETRRALRLPLNSLQNYTLLVSAINLMHRLSEDDFLRARDILNALVTRCPGHPEPLAWIGRWHVLRVQQGWAKDLKQESDLALSFTARALAIDPDSSLSLSSEGAVLVNLSHDLDKAEHCYSSALYANPNDAYARLLRGMLYAFQGKGEAAQSDCELSLRLAPMDPHRFLYLALAACANLAAQDHERALELAQASYRLNRSHTSTLRILAVAQLRMGMQQEAKKTARELMCLQPELRVQDWLNTSPSGKYEIGRNFADALRNLGVPR